MERRSVSPDLRGGLAAAIEREAAARGGLTPELPGEVYERTRAADRAARRADAVYYTPPHLVDFTIDRALGPLLGAGGDPLALRVVDPACGGGAFLLAALARPGGMGMGDVKLAGVLGLFLGAAVAPAILVALVTGVAVGGVVIARVGAAAGRKTAVPFGPFLALGGIVAVLAGEPIVDWYLRTLV